MSAKPACPGVATKSPAATHVALLTGGWDKPYALGLTAALVGQGMVVDFLGTAELDAPELHNSPSIRFFNLQRAPKPGGGLVDKALRTLTFYWRMGRYAATAQPRIFHILWNTKFLVFDRTLLLLYYKLLGKRVVFTAHNVNAGKRDGNDNWLNRLSLRIQYGLVDHIFAHTPKMKAELLSDFKVPETKVTVIPFGINETLRRTSLTNAEARERLGLVGTHRVMLFFGNILPYKGLEYLIRALERLTADWPDCRLIIAGRPTGAAAYWQSIEQTIAAKGLAKFVLCRPEHIPDDEVEVYFKAADVLVLPYTHIFQSGVLFLGYSFGLPVVATDVGSLREDVVEGKTGFICKPQDTDDLKTVIGRYFCSNLYAQLEERQTEIQEFASRRYSWTKAGEVTACLYRDLLGQR